MLHIRTFLEDKYGKELTEPEVFEYQNSLSKFIEILIEIDQKQNKKGQENDN